MIEQLQGLAGQRDLRITFASGGTGAAAIAQFYRSALLLWALINSGHLADSKQ